MKMLMTTLAFMLVFVGCSESDTHLVTQDLDAVSSTDDVSDVFDEAGEDVLSDVEYVDISVDVVQQEDSIDEPLDADEQEEPEQLDEDPTSFRSDSNPGSNFFTPYIP